MPAELTSTEQIFTETSRLVPLKDNMNIPCSFSLLPENCEFYENSKH